LIEFDAKGFTFFKYGVEVYIPFAEDEPAEYVIKFEE